MSDLIDRVKAINETNTENIMNHMDSVQDSDMKRFRRAVERILLGLPSVDAVSSEKLYDFIREIGAITYGKERFFQEEIGVHCGLWYDRESCEWITTQTAIEECLKAVRELDDGVLDAEPVRNGEWVSQTLPTIDAVPHWIPCSERLPKVRQWVLCQCRAGIMDVLRLTADGSWDKGYPHTEYMSGFVVAWMPLPKPYEVKE